MTSCPHSVRRIGGRVAGHSRRNYIRAGYTYGAPAGGTGRPRALAPHGLYMTAEHRYRGYQRRLTALSIAAAGFWVSAAH